MICCCCIRQTFILTSNLLLLWGGYTLRFPTIRKWISALAGLAAFTASYLPLPIRADPLLAQQPPDNWRCGTIVRMEKDGRQGLATLTDSFLLQWQPGPGIAAAVTIPLVYQMTPEGNASGVGDSRLTVLGHISVSPSLTLAPYMRFQFPTGRYDRDTQVNIGSNRYDAALGMWAIYQHDAIELDAGIEYLARRYNPDVMIEKGDILRGSFFVAYRRPYSWLGMEMTVFHQASDTTVIPGALSRDRDAQFASGQSGLTIGPEARFSLAEGALSIHASSKIGLDGSLDAEGRVLVDF